MGAITLWMIVCLEMCASHPSSLIAIQSIYGTCTWRFGLLPIEFDMYTCSIHT